MLSRPSVLQRSAVAMITTAERRRTLVYLENQVDEGSEVCLPTTLGIKVDLNRKPFYLLAISAPQSQPTRPIPRKNTHR
jgi:hypothetical protein